MTAQIVTSNRLDDGLVVFLTEAGGWSANVSDAAVANDDAAAQTLLAIGNKAVADCIIIEAVLIEVTVDGNVITPVELRERIRALGPTIDVPGEPSKHKKAA